jgi:hypothetical protein
MLAGVADGCTASLLLAQGFTSVLIAGLVDCELVTATTERVLVGQRAVEVMRVRITDRGRVALER